MVVLTCQAVGHPSSNVEIGTVVTHGKLKGIHSSVQISMVVFTCQAVGHPSSNVEISIVATHGKLEGIHSSVKSAWWCSHAKLWAPFQPLSCTATSLMRCRRCKLTSFPFPVGPDGSAWHTQPLGHYGTLAVSMGAHAGAPGAVWNQHSGLCVPSTVRS
eukprot:1136641-Pelagomonas_calceolata.AAC.1